MKYEIALEEDGQFVLYETHMAPYAKQIRRRIGRGDAHFDSEPEARAALEIWVQLRIHFKLGLLVGSFRYGDDDDEVRTVQWVPGTAFFQSTTIRPVNDGAMGAYMAGLIEESS